MKQLIPVLAVLIMHATVFNAYGQINVYVGFKGGLCIPNLSAGSDNKNQL